MPNYRDSNRQQINHLFMGWSWLLVSQMIKGIVHYSSYNHHFIIAISSTIEEQKYKALFSNLSVSNYELIFLNNISPFTAVKRYIKLLLSGVFIEYSKIKKWLPMMVWLEQSKIQNLILHQEITYNSVFFQKPKIPIYWCCWGNIPSPCKHKFLKRFTRSYWFEIFIRKCKLIITLTESDRLSLSSRYNLNNVVTSSYSYIYNYENLIPQNNSSRKVLVGNSALFLNEYLEIANKLKTCKNLHITFMCSYGRPDNNTYIKWKSNIKGILEPANTIEFWEENLPIEEYNKHLSTFSVFIAGMKRQSGLGACTTALSLGLKTYLNGVNYDYYKKKNIYVYHISELNGIHSDELVVFDEQLRKKNISETRIACGVDKSIKEWESIYAKVISNN